MPKIEIGTSAGIFLIDGRPYTSGQYQLNPNTGDLTATECRIKIVASQKTNGSISEAKLSQWTDNADAPFADLQAFFTYVAPFFNV